MTWDSYELGVLAATRKDLDTAREHLEQAGDDPRALLLLGQLTATSGGPRRSYYERAAALGSTDAAYNLGALHATNGDFPAALSWYLRAGELGDSGADRMAGVMYATGQGTPVDRAKAETHLRRAAAAGETAAYRDLGILRKDDPAESAHWFLRAGATEELTKLVPALRETNNHCLLGVTLAFFLGDVPGGTEHLTAASWYRDGFGGPIDLVQALRWFLTGNGIHQAHTIAAGMTPDKIHEAGRYLEADLLVRPQ